MDIISQIVTFLDKATTRSEPGKWSYAPDLSAVLSGGNVDRGPYSHGTPGFYFVCTRTLVPFPSEYQGRMRMDSSLTGFTWYRRPIEWIQRFIADWKERAAFRASYVAQGFWSDCALVLCERAGIVGLSDTPYRFPITREDTVNGISGHGGQVISLMTTLSKTVIRVEELAETINARAIKRGEVPPITIPGHTGSFVDHSDIPDWTLRGDQRPFQWKERGEELP